MKRCNSSENKKCLYVLYCLTFYNSTELLHHQHIKNFALSDAGNEDGRAQLTIISHSEGEANECREAEDNFLLRWNWESVLQFPSEPHKHDGHPEVIENLNSHHNNN